MPAAAAFHCDVVCVPTAATLPVEQGADYQGAAMTTPTNEPGEPPIKLIEFLIVLASVGILALLVSPLMRPAKVQSGPLADGLHATTNGLPNSNFLAYPASQAVLAGALAPRLEGSNIGDVESVAGNAVLLLAGDGRLTNQVGIQGGLLNLTTNPPLGKRPEASGSDVATNRIQLP
jgi:hypothetical protein